MRCTRWWSSLLALLIAAGVGVAALVWSPLVCVSAVGLISLFVLAVLEVFTGPPPAQGRPKASSLRRRLRQAVTSGGGLVALAALLQVSSPVTLALLLLLGLTSPPVTSRLRRASVHGGHREGQDSPPPTGARDGHDGAVGVGLGVGLGVGVGDTAPVAKAADDLGTCEVRMLCLQLRRTFWAMHETTDPEELLRLVTRRQRIIDELTRRNPQAMATWLESGARASGSPEKYFRTEPGPEGPRPT
jgi:hypothetical protein